jgi:hypothetical protein
MNFLFSFWNRPIEDILWDISLLLAVCTAVLLTTSEILSPRYGRINIKINRNKLQNTAIAFSILFLATIAIKVCTLI